MLGDTIRVNVGSLVVAFAIDIGTTCMLFGNTRDFSFPTIRRKKKRKKKKEKKNKRTRSFLFRYELVVKVVRETERMDVGR